MDLSNLVDVIGKYTKFFLQLIYIHTYICTCVCRFVTTLGRKDHILFELIKIQKNRKEKKKTMTTTKKNITQTT